MAESDEHAAVLDEPRLLGKKRDRDLLKEARKGSDEALEALVAQHWQRAHRIAYGILGDSHMAEDVTQEAMISVLANLGRFDTRRAFEPWLHRIVANRALDWARARTRHQELSRLVAPPASEAPPDPDLMAALAELTPDHRAVVVLRFVAGYGTGEIARMLGIRRGTVGSRLRRGLDQLKTTLEDGNG